MMIFKTFDQVLDSGRRWSVAYIDPPWDFSNRHVKYGDGSFANVKNKYSTMGLDQLRELPMSAILEQDAAVLLWTTDAHLEWAMMCGKAWGLKYSTVQFCWSKLTSTGKRAQILGPWGMKNVESCLLFTRGKAHSRLLVARNVRQYHEEVRGQHSCKPEHFAREVTRMFPFENKIEMFARRERRGWDSMGDEL